METFEALKGNLKLQKTGEVRLLLFCCHDSLNTGRNKIIQLEIYHLSAAGHEPAAHHTLFRSKAVYVDLD